MSAILQAARAAYAAGLAPVPTTNDGSKAPDLRTWKVYQTTRPSVEEMRTFNFAAHDGLGIIAGAGSGHRECWDFDTDDVFVAFVERAHASGLGPLVDRLIQGYLDRTPGGGRRTIVGYPAGIEFKDVTLARRPGRSGEPRIKTLIELPWFSIVAPSNGRTHPSGKAYERLQGGFDTIASYTADERTSLFSLAQTFDEMPRVEARPPSPKSSDAGTRPGDDYNRRTTWPELLEPHAWTIAFDRDGVTYWRRPDKTYGVSATTNYAGSDLLYVFSSSTLFDADKSYSKFAAYAVLEHQGDFGKAALALYKQGYGEDCTTDDEAPAGSTTTSTPTVSTTRSLRLTAANTITVRPVRWLWDERLPVGVFALIGGREGVGKSILCYTLAAGVTRGTLPGIYTGTPKAVIVAATEDSWEHTIVPRLLAAGADLTKVYRADIVDANAFELPLSLPKDTAALSRAITDVDAGVVIFDPLLSRLDARLDTHKDADTRRALEPLAAMADTMRVGVWGLIHVNKSTSTDALTTLMASRAFTAVARAVLFVAVDPDEQQQRLLSQAKNNLGRLDLPTLLFRINGVLVTTTPDGDDVWTGQLTWTGESDHSLRDVLEWAGEREGDKFKVRDAADWLLDYLESQGGTAARKDIVDKGRHAGHSERTLDRARDYARLKTDARGFPRLAYWLLPASSSAKTSSSGGGTGEVGGTEPVGETAAPVPPSSASSAKRQAPGEVGGTDATAPAAPVPPVPPTPPGSVADGGTGRVGGTEPQPSEPSLTEQRWKVTDEAFKKGWS